uniref:Uncharacterized protein n=1 Tax=Rhizophagus irregularis (strain DAOM 181602 / DAOM 197198 / MUCL 43194) TaxID=747089 RepID=U9TA56_RHIID
MKNGQMGKEFDYSSRLAYSNTSDDTKELEYRPQLTCYERYSRSKKLKPALKLPDDGQVIEYVMMINQKIFDWPSNDHSWCVIVRSLSPKDPEYFEFKIDSRIDLS